MVRIVAISIIAASTVLFTPTHNGAQQGDFNQSGERPEAMSLEIYRQRQIEMQLEMQRQQLQMQGQQAEMQRQQLEMQRQQLEIQQRQYQLELEKQRSERRKKQTE